MSVLHSSSFSGATAQDRTGVSIVLPVYNERQALRECYTQITEVMRYGSFDYEIVFVDDGSRDGSFEILRQIVSDDPHCIALRLGRNFGQTAAFSAGINAARGETIVLMDADLQNDPADIPKLLNKIEEGVDVVSGWRRRRHDGWLTRTLPSRIANRLISAVTGVRLHDFGCSLKAYRSEMLSGIHLYGDMHRFIPILLQEMGARICEVEVNHRPRTTGRSSYGLSRVFKVIVDLLLLRFLSYHSTKSIHTFGGFGLLNFLLAFILGCWAVYFKVTGQKDFVETPLPVLVALFALVGVISIFIGFLSEILVRTYYESQGKPPYSVVETIRAERRS
ncbi:glycosyltransferase [bacterium]|nr:MAG: glycosyltransferase [bacterium]